MRVLAALSLSLALAVPSAAAAQAKLRPRIPLPPPAQTAAAPPSPPPRATLAPLRMGGLPPAPDGGGTCRAQCSKDRYRCSGDEDPTDCNGRWLTCLTICRAP